MFVVLLINLSDVVVNVDVNDVISVDVVVVNITDFVDVATL